MSAVCCTDVDVSRAFVRNRLYGRCFPGRAGGWQVSNVNVFLSRLVEKQRKRKRQADINHDDITEGHL